MWKCIWPCKYCIQVWIFVTPFHERWINIFCVEDTCLFFLEILMFMFGNQMPHSPQREVLFWVWGPWGKFLKCALIFTLDCIGFRELFCKERRQWSIAQGNSAKISPRRRKLSCQKEIIDCGHCQGIPNYELLSIMFAFYWCRDPLIKSV